MKNEFKQEYEKLRKIAEDEAAERREAAYQAEPELKRIAEERRSVIFQMGLISAASGDPAAAREKALSEIQRLNKLEEDILLKLGYEKDHLEPRYRCSMCSDTGFLGNVIQKPCSCYLKRLSARDFASSNLNSGESFENFDLNIFKDLRQRSLMKNAKALCEQYANGLPDSTETKNLLLMGKTGLGKTYLVNCIAHRAFQRNVHVIKLTGYNLIGRVLKSIREGTNIEDVMNVPVLCIDDLGTEPMMTNITREYIFSILNERLNAGLNTVVATNLSYDDILDRYEERVFSRLISLRYCKVLMLEGEDVRLSVK
ncbi:MAG: Primosomal protein DnaI [Firmicutes bacterium ADurb.Bin182]|nr:MAG: Primosomal protein DnaI [Firmicutes bacterium ADurb.Bin182]